MLYINKHYNNTHEVKQSKFISHLVPYSLYSTTLEDLKSSHPKARHFVTASRHLNEYMQIVESSSDDGEPKGTSGKPTLMVLQGSGLINVAIIIVRYFGGTKLGTGGLVRAYSDATNLVIEKSELIEYKEEETISISFEYSDIRKIEYECDLNNIRIIHKSFEQNSIYKIKASKDDMKKFLAKMDRIVNVH